MAHNSKTLQQAFHYLWPDEVDALKELARMLPLNPIIVNIGAGAGTSGLCFAEARKDCTLYTIDITQESSPFGCLIAEKEVLREAGFDVDSETTRFYQICLDSKIVGSEWAKFRGMPLVDMVFIDGDHSYEGAKGDIENWLPNIKRNGIIAVHDYDKAEAYKREHNPADVPHWKPWPGVDNAVKDFLLGKLETILQVDTLIAFRVGDNVKS